MYDKIVNPLTGRKVKLKGKIGKKILKTYLKKIGGRSRDMWSQKQIKWIPVPEVNNRVDKCMIFTPKDEAYTFESIKNTDNFNIKNDIDIDSGQHKDHALQMRTMNQSSNQYECNRSFNTKGEKCKYFLLNKYKNNKQLLKYKFRCLPEKVVLKEYPYLSRNTYNKISGTKKISAKLPNLSNTKYKICNIDNHYNGASSLPISAFEYCSLPQVCNNITKKSMTHNRCSGKNTFKNVNEEWNSRLKDVRDIINN